MFVAKFNQVTSEKFAADKNGNKPFIGEVLAGQASGTVINGTMFQREGLQPNKLYACENTIDPQYPDNVQVKVISEISIVEFMGLRTHLGEGKFIGAGAPEATTVADAIAGAIAG